MGKKREDNLLEEMLGGDNDPTPGEGPQSGSPQGEPSQDESSTYDSEVPEEPLNDLEKAIAEFSPENVSAGGSQKEFDENEVDAVVNAIVSTYGIGKRTAYVAVTEMIRRGGHAVSVPPSFSVEIYCPNTGSMSTVYKRDVVRIIELCTKNRKTFKNLAHTLSRSIVRMGIYRLDKNPGSDWPGDLARKIDNRLAVRKQPPLSPMERVGCASYAQHLPDLDTLCNSDRLRHLLAEDLESRRKSQSPQGNKQGNRQQGGNQQKQKKDKKKGK